MESVKAHLNRSIVGLKCQGCQLSVQSIHFWLSHIFRVIFGIKEVKKIERCGFCSKISAVVQDPH